MLLVRHASAGDRTLWEGDDGERPLDEKGIRQAEALVDLLEPYAIERIFSSPAKRCLQTVEPLSRARGLTVEAREELTEDVQSTAGAELVQSCVGDALVICGHGGLEQALREPPRWKKSAVFVVGDGLDVLEMLRPKL